MAKWLDKYENGGEYLGTTNVGRNYSPAWGGQFQMGGYVYPTTFVPQAEMGGSIPGSVGFTYARTQGIPSEGPYAKKTLPSAQNGKLQPIKPLPKRTDSDYENFFEIFDPTGISSWDDVYRSYKKSGLSSETALEVLGALPLLGNIAKVTKPGIHLAKYSKVDKALFNTLPKNKSLSRIFSGASKTGRGTDAYQTYEQHKNGGEMSFYQHGLDWTPRNISEYGSEIPMAQGGEDVPYWMKRSSDISQRVNQNLKTEIAAQKTKEKKAQEARTRTTIGADTRTAKQKEKDRQAYESKLKYEKEVLGKDFETPQYIQDKNRARAEHLIHLADVGSMGAGLVEGIGKLALKNVPKPTSVSSSVDNVGRGFKSEIDWGAWNPETPKHKVLMDEYNAIEESTKKAGTWMKYSDGTPFQGTPEQFIQMKSKSAQGFAGGVKESEDMYRNMLYRGAHEHVVDFKNRDRNDWATFLTSDKKNAITYAGSDLDTAPFFNPNIHESGDWVDGIYELGISSKHPKVIGDAEGRGWRLLNYDEGISSKIGERSNEHNEYLKEIFERGDTQSYGIGEYNPLQKYLSTDDYATYVKDRNNPEAIAEIRNVKDQMGSRTDVSPNTVYAIDAERVPIKSLRHNVGFFDITNPNIYKGVIPYAVPAAIGAGALQQKKQGGVVKDNMGYWNPDNWGKVVEIDSPNITMQGVNQDLIGISDEGDVQYMEPGKDYKFKGKKVKEYPVAKYGVNQQDEKTAQHLDQLTNFTNYNKPKAKSGGWLDKY